MRHIFIDVGARHGRIVESFKKKKIGKYFEFYMFECHKENIKLLKKLGYGVVIEGAAWVEDTEIPFYYGNSIGGSLNPTKTTGKVSPEEQYPVKAYDIVKYIKERFTKEDYIILKMNCEGAEYDLIPHMVKHGLKSWINEWYVKWHQHKLKNISIETHDKISGLIKTSNWELLYEV